MLVLKAPATYAHFLTFNAVIRKLVNGFMCRLDSSVNYIIQGILATSLRYTSRIYTGVVYYILIVDRTNYTIHIVCNVG